jgi:Flp pilus assembly protein TadB
VINLLLSLGAAAVLVILTRLLGITLWIGVPMGLAAGLALFIYLGRKVQQDLEKIFTRAGEMLKKQKFDAAI